MDIHANFAHCSKKTPLMSTLPQVERVKSLIENLLTLCDGLPSSIPLASQDDHIYHVMTTVNGDDAWQTFNRRFDLLFGDDLRNVEGRLLHIRRGKYGMDVVCIYLRSIDLETPGLFHDLMALKLTRVIEEIIHLMSVVFTVGQQCESKLTLPLDPMRLSAQTQVKLLNLAVMPKVLERLSSFSCPSSPEPSPRRQQRVRLVVP